MANTPNSETSSIKLEVINAAVSSSDTNPGGYVGFYGTTPVAQRASSVQATSIYSLTAVSTAYASAEANAVYLAVKEIVATLSAVGLWKGAA